MHRFYASDAAAAGKHLMLPEAEAKHAVQVLRLKTGDSLLLLDGKGNKWECRITSSGKKSLGVELLTHHRVPAPIVPVDVFVPLAKGKAMDLIVQKVTELGAARIIPVSTDHCVTQLDQEQIEDKIQKWNQIAIEALKQCANTWLPKIEPSLPLSKSLQNDGKTKLNLVAALTPATTPVRRQFDDFLATHGKMPERIGIWVGPEGDFSPREYALLQDSGVRAVTLGGNILRCETAVISLLAISQQEILTR